MDKLKEQIQSAVNVYKSGNLSKAEKLCGKLIEENPKVAFLYNLLGLIFAGQKKESEAIEYYNKGLKIDPNYALIYNNLGLIYVNKKSNEDLKKSENFYKKSISLDKKIPEPHNNLGSLYNSLSKYDEAINCYKNAININPKFSAAHYNLGKVYITIGKFDEAKNHLREAIELNSDFTHAHRALSRILKYNNKEKHLEELEIAYRKSSEDSDSKMGLAFALGKAHEDIKKFDSSFKLYEEANFIQRKRIKFSINDEQDRFNKIKSCFTEDLFSKFHKSGCENKNPIFILGMPRSGTTLVEQIISNHPDVFGADEVDFIPSLIQKHFGHHNLNIFYQANELTNLKSENLKMIGNEYIDKMNKLSNNRIITTDKLPINFFWIGFIKLILPKAKIIHCCRNSKDNILSIFKNHFPGGKVSFAYSLKEIIEYYNMYADLMKYWNSKLPNFIHNIKYENLISDTRTSIENLLKFCDLTWSNKCLNFHNNNRPIQTASDVQARSKIYSTSINSWKNYEKHLEKYFFNLKY